MVTFKLSKFPLFAYNSDWHLLPNVGDSPTNIMKYYLIFSLN